MTENNIETQEQLSAWVREQFQRANKYLAEQGILFESVVTEESRYLAPFVAVWKIKSTEGKFYWVTSGDVACDYMPFENEATARLAMKHFSFSWQAKAESIMQTSPGDEQQQAIAEGFIKDAETMYQVQAKDDLWKEG